MIRESWASRFGFIMATVGFSVGLGNIWRFPYMTGSNGGGAFLAIYLVLALFIGIPLFTMEISLGRKSQLSPIAGMRKLTGGAGSPWNAIGWLGVVAAFLIMSYYQLLMGWLVAYFLRAAGGGFTGATVEEVEAIFTGFTSDPVTVLGYAAVVIVTLGLIVGRGLRRGVEWAAKWMLPLLFAFMILLAAGSVSFEGAMEGVAWYLRPDFSRVDGGVVLAALGQVFYSIGVGMAGAFAFGSYLSPDDSDIPGSATTIVAFDTLAAFLAGLVMFPALFAFGFQPDVGPGLLFVSMSSLFAQVPAGSLVGGAFFFLVLIAGLTSGLALTETLTATLMDSLGWTRRRALWVVLGIIYLTGIPIALGFGPWADVRLFGLDLFGFVDFVSSNVLLTLGGLFIAVYTAYVWGFGSFREEANRGSGLVTVQGAWRPFVVFVIPVAVALVMLSSLGVF